MRIVAKSFQLNARGQALIELAIFGMIALAALGLLIRIGIQANHEQEIRMAAFRRALAAAKADDRTPGGVEPSGQDAMAVNFHYMIDRQLPDPGDGFMSMPRTQSQASAFVEWGERLTYAFEDEGVPNAGKQTQPRTIVRLNNEEKSFRQDDFQDEGDFKFNSLISDSVTTNTSGATFIEQTTTRTGASSNTGTRSTVIINTINQDEIISNIGSGANAGWDR